MESQQRTANAEMCQVWNGHPTKSCNQPAADDRGRCKYHAHFSDEWMDFVEQMAEKEDSA